VDLNDVWLGTLGPFGHDTETLKGTITIMRGWVTWPTVADKSARLSQLTDVLYDKCLQRPSISGGLSFVSAVV
jgi:hypothetical protein